MNICYPAAYNDSVFARGYIASEGPVLIVTLFAATCVCVCLLLQLATAQGLRMYFASYNASFVVGDKFVIEFLGIPVVCMSDQAVQYSSVYV